MQQLLASPLRNLIAGLAFMAVVCNLAVAAYVACGWSVSDALYMVVMTVFTVGFREVRPVDTALLRGVTIGLMVFGCTGMLFLTGVLVQLISASQFQQFFGVRRMQKDIDRLSGHVIVCGYGRIGQNVAAELRAGGVDFVIIERDEARLPGAWALGLLAMQGDATDEDCLRAAGIVRARALATVLPDDSTNVFVTLSARSLNRSLTIIARGEKPSTENKLLQAGAHRVVLPTYIGAERIAELLLFPELEELLLEAGSGDAEGSRWGVSSKGLAREMRRIGLELEVVAAAAGSRSVGRSVAEVEAAAGGSFLVVALERRNGTSVLQPPTDTIIQAGDGVAIVGRPGRAMAVQQAFA